MTHPLLNDSEGTNAFLRRMAALRTENAASVFINANDLDKLIRLVEHWRRRDVEAARHVESVVCLQSSRFTGYHPYVGWKGVGLALEQDYAELRQLRKAAGASLFGRLRRAIHAFLSPFEPCDCEGCRHVRSADNAR